ncbi:betaine--homocysteine s-methyltransferase 1-like [Plakobranchus ocellatus]|uniref:Betaine--homocysteine s-methyltransferase 1-like n=1 Tax=Plakobranchus ocellatus TaxID=259542 RepID=A0AAV4C4N3_9GAST|nr:betaine--homocysteine s-methyltransferase 1-like [Plakobranchus ocellatus]
MATTNRFLEWLSKRRNLVVAEGYLFEFERRGYLKAGAFVPEVVLEHPDLVKALHEEFVHAGSDVVLAFTYYAHREKLCVIGKEDVLETLNKKALAIAKEVAIATGTLFAGNICNTTVYVRDDEKAKEKAKFMLKEQVEWAVEAGVDFIVAETFDEYGEASLALEVIKTYGKGTPAVVTLSSGARDITFDGYSYAEACRKLEEAGAAVVGLNCGRGPETILPLMKEIRKACKGPVACLPVLYRTSEQYKTMQSLVDPKTGQKSFPVDLPAHFVSRTDVLKFSQECKDLGVEYIGLCCGNSSHYMRIMAEIYGRHPPACRFSPDMSQHYMCGDKTRFKNYHTEGLMAHKN